MKNQKNGSLGYELAVSTLRHHAHARSTTNTPKQVHPVPGLNPTQNPQYSITPTLPKPTRFSCRRGWQLKAAKGTKIKLQVLRYPKPSLVIGLMRMHDNRPMRGLHLTRQSRFNKPESKLNQSESNLIKVKIPISAIPDLSTHDSPKIRKLRKADRAPPRRA